MGQTAVHQTMTDVLNKQIANWGILYVKLHNYHWLVKGEGFYELHEKFEEFYNEAAEFFDEIAERLLALNGKPVGTMRDFLQYGSITEAKGTESPQQMVEIINEDFNTLIEEMKAGTKIAEENEDQPTGDMFNHIRFNLEKKRWMLNAFLSK